MLRQRPLSFDDITAAMDMDPGEVTRCIDISAMHGLIRYDQTDRLYATAQDSSHV